MSVRERLNGPKTILVRSLAIVAVVLVGYVADPAQTRRIAAGFGANPPLAVGFFGVVLLAVLFAPDGY